MKIQEFKDWLNELLEDPSIPSIEVKDFSSTYGTSLTGEQTALVNENLKKVIEEEGREKAIEAGLPGDRYFGILKYEGKLKF